jgi:hypothetical protein
MKIVYREVDNRYMIVSYDGLTNRRRNRSFTCPKEALDYACSVCEMCESIDAGLLIFAKKTKHRFLTSKDLSFID